MLSNKAISLDMETQSQLCDFCRTLFSQKLTFHTKGNVPALGLLAAEDERSDEERPARTVEDFQQAIIDGCHLCFLFWTYLSESARTYATECDIITYNVYGCDTPDDVVPDIRVIQLMFFPTDGDWELNSLRSAFIALIPTLSLQPFRCASSMSD